MTRVQKPSLFTSKTAKLLYRPYGEVSRTASWILPSEPAVQAATAKTSLRNRRATSCMETDSTYQDTSQRGKNMADDTNVKEDNNIAQSSFFNVYF